jgi:parallel beta-helix repeat protein
LNLSGAKPDRDLTLVTVNDAGVPTPGTVTVEYTLGVEAEFYTTPALNGNLTIDGFIVHSAFPGIEVTVDGGLGADRNILIQNVTATETEHDGIQVSADGNVTISNCTASDNAYNGINVTGVGGDVTITDCTANDNGVVPEQEYSGIVVYSVDGNAMVTNCTAQRNGDDGIFVGEVEGNVNISNSTGNSNGDEGIDVYDVGGNVTIRNCTAKGNGYDGIEPSEIAGAVEVSACISQDNGDDGIDLLGLKEADSILVNGNIICGNVSDGLELNIAGIGEATVAATGADATGNWWGCPGGPGPDPCDTVNAVDGTV